MNSSKLIIGCLTTLGLAVAAASQAHADADRDAIAERLKPVGQVCLQGQDCGTAAAAENGDDTADTGNGIDGEAVYGRVCAACHDSGAAGAPMMDDADAWAERLDQGIETLYEHAISGIGAMPARGGDSSLSDEEVMASTNYLIESVYDGDLPEIGGDEEVEMAEAANGEGEAEVADVSDEANGNGEEDAAAEEEVAAAEEENGLDGEALYASGGCAACHDSGAAGAPIVGDDWGDRMDQDISELYANAINGIGAMPPKGGNTSLSDEEVEAIVDYMVAASE
ncbi:cytochrome c5 family protein [Halomonas sp. ML-15]|uniref:c-type cytochrome n=1 Tax=Halomonas sp. ML-15 TaxID=2773305 RepID=UPI0017475340|nr:c-type cytochrome [Halomonas sp. ML-15]MBD3897895.1 cytochrome c5 family protein [Halomonas sp. ML-15]